MRYGSLFSGILGLDGDVEHVTGASPAWRSEVDSAVCAWYRRRDDGVANLGDVAAVDWPAVEPVDVLCGGFPCQDVSLAGNGAGIAEGTRSGLWYAYADAIGVLRPGLVVVENVAALLVRGLDVVVGDLAELGYDCRWGVVRASDAGMPHRRQRVFLVAWPAADAERVEPLRRHGTGSVRGAAAPVEGGARQRERAWDTARDRGQAPADTDGRGQRLPGIGSGRDADEWGEAGDYARNGDRARGHTWGPYAAAVARWEHLSGEPAPAPLVGRQLNGDLTRWMMGFPAGWCDGMTNRQTLKACGNAVAPPQAELALSLLLGFARQAEAPVDGRWLPTPTARLGDQRGALASRYVNPERSNDLDDAMAWLVMAAP